MKSSTKTTLIIIGIILAAFVLFVAMFASANNKAIFLEEQVKGALSNIEVAEKRRVDLVYNLVAVFVVLPGTYLTLNDFAVGEGEDCMMEGVGHIENLTIATTGCSNHKAQNHQKRKNETDDSLHFVSPLLFILFIESLINFKNSSSSM